MGRYQYFRYLTGPIRARWITGSAVLLVSNMAGLYLDSRGYLVWALEFICNTYPGANVSICDCLDPFSYPLPLSLATSGIGDTDRYCVAGLCLVSFPYLDITMSGRRSVSRVRTRRGATTPDISPERLVREINLD